MSLCCNFVKGSTSTLNTFRIVIPCTLIPCTLIPCTLIPCTLIPCTLIPCTLILNTTGPESDSSDAERYHLPTSPALQSPASG